MLMHKNRQHTAGWLILALIAAGFAIWQAQVTPVKTGSTGQSLKMTPTKTRRADRSKALLAANEKARDPIAKYADRRKVGLSDQEIEWIVNDFKYAKLDLGIRVATNIDYLNQRRAQDLWYRDALVEAWSLTPDQAAQATAKLAELCTEAQATLAKAFEAACTFDHNGTKMVIIGSEPIHQLIGFNLRLQDDRAEFLPWNLCQMSLESNPIKSEKERMEDTQPLPTSPDEIVEPYEPIILLRDDLTLLKINRFLPQPIPAARTIETELAVREEGELQQLRKLHPAQLKLLLLTYPDITSKIQQLVGTSQ
jgi:hypothetical protein